MPKYRSMPVYRPVGTKKPAHFCAGRLFRKGLQANDIDLTPRLFGKLFLKSSCNTRENLSLDSLEKGAATC